MNSFLTKIKLFFHNCRNTPDNYKLEYVELVDVITAYSESFGTVYAKYKLTCLTCGKEKYVFKDFFFTPAKDSMYKETIIKARSFSG